MRILPIVVKFRHYRGPFGVPLTSLVPRGFAGLWPTIGGIGYRTDDSTQRMEHLVFYDSKSICSDCLVSLLASESDPVYHAFITEDPAEWTDCLGEPHAT